MTKISLASVLVLAAIAGPALAQSGGERFCKQYASSAADNARQAIGQNPSCQDFSKGVHANESMHFQWCMKTPRSEVEGALNNIIRLADRCTQRQAAQPPAVPVQQTVMPQAGVRYDKPSAVRNIKPKPGADGTEITCSYFPDFMIRQETEGPSAGVAVLVRGANPPCNASPASGGISLVDTDNMHFQGRKGAALFFAGEPSGSGPFVVIDAQSGKLVLRDSLVWDDKPLILAASFENGGLRLRYRRGVNAPCSIMENAARCWAQMVQDRLLPQDMAKQILSPRICEAAYRAMTAPKENPSIVIYDNEIVVFGNGDTKVLSRGPISCGTAP